MSQRLLLTRRIAQLLVGLVLYGISLAMMVRAGLGVAPWDVLTQGIAKQTGLGFGLITVLVGAVVLLAWIPIRQKPGIGTVLNVLIVGPAADLGFLFIPEMPGGVEALPARILLFAAGLALLAVATGLYIGARFGPGPRDGLMTGIHARTGWPVWVVRTAIEIAVLGTGWLLGGNVGLGTVAFALLIGPMVGVTLPLLRVPEPVAPEATAPGDPSSPESTKEVPA
ncbi:membrane protein YczE [Homoserinibacter sp. YIM 151385]|uniref:membrane protein YczE n=1 Tax=Homoserinibacter sp. YIM 151385 TaxID=2985506 RepID=UPI0022F0E834|nr:hypothetical protein [Homoserinibacter sp. YIM 151385]WBU37406.1 hypothetical protein OF852_10845 [Homoserinibacter sp. YIM 151385]